MDLAVVLALVMPVILFGIGLFIYFLPMSKDRLHPGE